VSYFSKDVESAVEWSMLQVFWLAEAGDCFANKDSFADEIIKLETLLLMNLVLLHAPSIKKIRNKSSDYHTEN